MTTMLCYIPANSSKHRSPNRQTSEQPYANVSCVVLIALASIVCILYNNLLHCRKSCKIHSTWKDFTATIALLCLAAAVPPCCSRPWTHKTPCRNRERRRGRSSERCHLYKLLLLETWQALCTTPPLHSKSWAHSSTMLLLRKPLPHKHRLTYLSRSDSEN